MFPVYFRLNIKVFKVTCRLLMVTLTLDEAGCSALLLGLGHEAWREAACSRTGGGHQANGLSSLPTTHDDQSPKTRMRRCADAKEERKRRLGRLMASLQRLERALE